VSALITFNDINEGGKKTYDFGEILLVA
jgi:hypothetical protein